MSKNCVRCGIDLRATGIHVFVNGVRTPGAGLCDDDGRNGQNMLTVARHACLRCGLNLTGQIPVAIMVQRTYVPGSLCLDHGSNGDDRMTAAQYLQMVMEYCAA